MASFYYTYEDFGTNRRLKSLYPTQALADIAAFTDSTLTANQGAVDIPDNVSVGWVWDTTDAAWREQEFGDLSELEQKKSSAQKLHTYLIDTRAAIQLVAHERIQAHVQHLQEFEAMAHWANYVVAHMSSISTALFIAWTERMVLGPSGATDLHSLFEQVHGLEDVKIPLEACAWVDPADATQVVGLDTARGNSTQNTPTNWFMGETTDLYDIDLANGAWIRELT